MSDGDRGDEHDAPGPVPPAGERAWRHPSELGAPRFVPSVPPPGARHGTRRTTARSRTGLVVLAGLGGVLALAGLVALRHDGDDDVVAATTVVAQAYRGLVATAPPLRLVVRDGTDVRTVPAFSPDGAVVIALTGAVAPSAMIEVDDGNHRRPARVRGADASGLLVVVVDDVVAQTRIGAAGGLHGGDMVSVGGPDGAATTVDELGFDGTRPVVRLAGDAGPAQLVWSRGALVAISLGSDRLALPVEVAGGVAAAAERGVVASPYLGVNLASDGSTSVSAVTDGSPAAAAGVRAGDRVRKVEAGAVGSAWQLAVELRRHAPGEAVRLTLERDGAPVTVTAVLTART